MDLQTREELDRLRGLVMDAQARANRIDASSNVNQRDLELLRSDMTLLKDRVDNISDAVTRLETILER